MSVKYQAKMLVVFPIIKTGGRVILTFLLSSDRILRNTQLLRISTKNGMSLSNET